MLNVMIVDDEIIVRVGFQSCINWEDYGCRITATCESAKDAVCCFEKEAPDIVFTDIMMPEMNGIELVKYIRDNYPRTKVVVLSCVDEIESVKQAIKLGAEDYILKLSFTTESLISLITRLKESIAGERRREGRDDIYAEIQSFNREEGLRMLLSGNLTVTDCEALLDELGYPYDPFEQYCAGCFLIDRLQTVRAARGSETDIMRYGLLNIIREYVKKLPKFDLAFIGDGEILILFRFKAAEGLVDAAGDILKPLNNALLTHLNVTLSLGLNPVPCGRMEIAACYRRARELAGLRFFHGYGSFHSGEKNLGKAFATRRSVQKGIQEAIFKQDDREAFRLIDQWFQGMKELCSYEQILNIRRSVVETWIFISGYTLPGRGEEYGEIYSIEDLWEAETIEELKGGFEEAVRAVIHYLQVNKTANPEILKLLRYLETHLDENISLESAAGRCALGKSQFCILFKKCTGESFVNYFNRLKMERAFALLSSENIQVQEAAAQIGIRDISYFSRLFKKYYHMSPSDVRKL